MRTLNNFRTIARFLVAGGCLAAASAALAQAPGPMIIPDTGMIGECNFVNGDFSYDCFPLYLAYLIRLVFTLAGGFALMEIIKGGYEYALSGAQAIGIDKESAKKRITHAIVGMIVVVLAYLIIDTLVSAVFLGPV